MLILFSCKVLSNFSSFSPSPLTFQVAYLNHSTFPISEPSVRNNPSGFFLWDWPVVWISRERVTSPEQGKSSGRTAAFSLWTGMFWDGISCTPDKKVIYTAVSMLSLPRLWEQRRWGWLLGRIRYGVTHHYLIIFVSLPLVESIMHTRLCKVIGGK
jgi:hypothetical protein